MRIEYICFTSYSGFAFAAKNNIKALNSVGLNVVVRPLDLGFNRSINLRDFKFFTDLVKDLKGDVQIYHCIPIMQRRVPYRERVIGCATYENFQIPQEWINILEHNDLVYVPSQFNLESFSKKLNNVVYIPHCLDFSDYFFQERKSHFTYRFLFFGTWKTRKNYDLLLRAFLNEFSNEKVSLTIKTPNSPLRSPFKSISRIFKQLNKTADIQIDTSILKDEDICSFLQGFDCLVCPTLGEGFGYPGLQAMASGLPLIISNYSGTKEYARSDNCLLLEPEGFERKKDIDGILQFYDREWPIISEEQLRRKMREAYENREDMRQRALKAFDFVEKKFNYNIVGKKFKEIL